MSEEPRRPRHAAPDDDQQVATPTWQPPPPVRWETPEPSISGRLDDAEPPAAERTVFHAPVRGPQPPGRIPGANDLTRPAGSMTPVPPPDRTQAIRPAGAPQPPMGAPTGPDPMRPWIRAEGAQQNPPRPPVSTPPEGGARPPVGGEVRSPGGVQQDPQVGVSPADGARRDPAAGAPWPPVGVPVAGEVRSGASEGGARPESAWMPAVEAARAVRFDSDAPQPTSVLASAAPETQSIRPPASRPESVPGVLPDPGTESVLPERSTGGRTGGSGSVPGAFPGTSRRTSSRTSRARRGRLGAGLVEVPPVPYRDPASAVLTDPVVSEEKRFCGSCSAKVGRGSDGKPGSAEGKCENCGTSFSFLPKLQPNEVVGGQYEVLGALAYGGLGWIYLAQDHNVSDRWVVLKGLIDTGDATAMAAAANEQRFLAEVEHPNIVKIHNFVQHPDRQSGTTVGYIVMEYVGGQSLRQLALAHHRESRRPEPLPIGQVVAYGLEILPAMGYLHSQGLLYCDLKPDNVIQTNEQLKLIDLGAVRRTDDFESPLFFTTGYSAPELATQGASVASDLFTVGRTLAVLSFEFTGYTTKFKTSLPGADAVPLFALFGSYHRFLKRATHSDPDRRFLSAEEMSDQLTGVLREIMALGTGKPRPGVSTVFGPESRTFGVQLVVPETGGNVPLPPSAEVVAGLPIPQVDTDDPAAGVLATTTSLEPRGAIDALTGAPRESIEVRLRIVRARIELGELSEAQRQLQAAQYLAIKNGFPHDWRIDWYRGLIELAGGRSRVAHVAFESVYDDLPGEIAPKLALGVSAEGVGDHFAAARFYELVWRTDRTYVSAAFGLARVYLAQGARSGAVEVLEAVPASSTHYVDAQVAAIKIKTTATKAAGKEVPVTERDLLDASARLERLGLDAERRTRLSAGVLEAAYDWVRAPQQSASTPGARVLGCPLDERELRFGLERCYRTLARLAGTVAQRVELVDKANAIRPRTLT